MRHYFTLDGKSSTDFNTWIAKSNMFDGAEHDDNSVEIPGRNGAIILSNNRYKNFSGTVSCYIPHHMRHYVDALRSFLSARHQYCRYEDTMHPEVFLMARFKGGFSLSESDRVGAAFDLVFDCKPQRFLKSGEPFIDCASGAVLNNPTWYDALPLIVCSGNGTITINGTTMTISNNTGQIYIDCDIQDAYLGSVNKNNMITPDFFKLVPGDNEITYDGVTDVQIMPRWWTI